MINWNKFGFNPGDIVTLDEDFNNSSNVKIISFTPKFLYAKICDIDDVNEDECWTVMTHRLSPLKEVEPLEEDKFCTCDEPNQKLFPDNKWHCLKCWKVWYR